jgi:hypothetical protein
MNPVSGGGALAVLGKPKQRGTAKEQRVLPLFLRSPNRRQPRISAEKETSTVDNLPQKQQKQRERACGLLACSSLNASEHQLPTVSFERQQ